MKYNDKGPEVRELQRALIRLGYSLNTYGIDGHLGEETWQALERFALDSGIEWQPGVPTSALTAIAMLGPVPQTVDNPPLPPLDADVTLFDLRSVQTNPPVIVRKGKRVNKHRLDVNGAVFERSVRSINSITLHQTAVEFSPRRRDLKNFEDPRRALAQRSLEVACHAMSFDGFFAVPNPLSWWVHHANGLNPTDLGLEVDGLFPGLVAHRQKHHTVLTQGRIEAARAALRFLVEEGRKAGMPIQFVHAHRQSSPSRRADPGEEIWKALVVDYAVPVLGLKVELSKVLVSKSRKSPGPGRPVPSQWDSLSKAKY